MVCCVQYSMRCLHGAFMAITSTSLKSTTHFCGEGGGVGLVT